MLNDQYFLDCISQSLPCDFELSQDTSGPALLLMKAIKSYK